MGELRNYHVVLADGSERNVNARYCTIDNGVLTFTNEELVLAYASGEWKSVEVERLDDKG